MIIKDYLPFRFSREGYVPDRLYLQFFDGNSSECFRHLSEQKKTAHYHLAKDGTVTVLTPLSSAANLLGPIRDNKNDTPVSAARRGVLILAEGTEGILCDEQRDPLIRLLKRIQKEVLRIYGERFPLCHQGFFCDGKFSPEDLLEEGILPEEEKTLFRVQTGSYQNRRDAEDRVEQLQRAGIAAYITEVKRL